SDRTLKVEPPAAPLHPRRHFKRGERKGTFYFLGKLLGNQFFHRPQKVECPLSRTSLEPPPRCGGVCYSKPAVYLHSPRTVRPPPWPDSPSPCPPTAASADRIATTRQAEMPLAWGVAGAAAGVAGRCGSSSPP